MNNKRLSSFWLSNQMHTTLLDCMKHMQHSIFPSQLSHLQVSFSPRPSREKQGHIFQRDRVRLCMACNESTLYPWTEEWHKFLISVWLLYRPSFRMNNITKIIFVHQLISMVRCSFWSWSWLQTMSLLIQSLPIIKRHSEAAEVFINAALWRGHFD